MNNTDSSQQGVSSPSTDDFLKRFLSAAERFNPNFVLSPFDRPLLPKLESLLQGSLSAIDSAARLLQFVSVRELCGAMDKNPSLFGKLSDRDSLSIPDMELAWLYLDGEKRDAVLRLAVFPASFSRGVAEKALQVSATDLSLLSSRSLLLRKGPSRYEVNPRFRSFLERELEASPRCESWRQAHTAYFFEKLAALSSKSGEDEARAVGELKEQALDLTRAFARVLPAMEGERADGHLKALCAVLRKLGHFQELADFIALFSASPRPEGPLEERISARVSANLGAALLRLGKRDESLSLMLLAIESTRKPGMEALHEETLWDLSSSLMRYGVEKIAEMKPAFLLRLQDCRKAGKPLAEAEALHQLGRLEDVLGETAQMRKWLEPAMAIFSKHGDRQRYQLCLGLLADRCMKDGDYKDARNWALQFLSDAEISGEKYGLVWAQLRVADVEMLTGETGSAMIRLGQSLRLSDPTSERWNWAFFHNKLGEALRLDGQSEEAARISGVAAEAFDAMNDAWGGAWSRDFSGFALYLSGKKTEGRSLMEKAAASLRKQKDSATLMACLIHLGEARLKLDGPAAAWPELREALNLALVGGYQPTQIEALAAMAACLSAAGKSLGAELTTLLPRQPQFSLACRALFERHALRPGAKTPALTLLSAIEQAQKISI